jgi:hypothetical protein
MVVHRVAGCRPALSATIALLDRSALSPPAAKSTFALARQFVVALAQRRRRSSCSEKSWKGHGLGIYIDSRPRCKSFALLNSFETKFLDQTTVPLPWANYSSLYLLLLWKYVDLVFL